MEIDSLAYGYGSTSPYNGYAAEQTAPAPRAEATAPASETEGAQQARSIHEPIEKEHEPHSEQTRAAANSMLTKAIEEANKKLGGVNRELAYSVHQKTGRLVIKVLNSDTHEVIREVPPENTLEQFAKVLELAGLFVDEKR